MTVSQVSQAGVLPRDSSPVLQGRMLLEDLRELSQSIPAIRFVGMRSFNEVRLAVVVVKMGDEGSGRKFVSVGSGNDESAGCQAHQSQI